MKTPKGSQKSQKKSQEKNTSSTKLKMERTIFVRKQNTKKKEELKSKLYNNIDEIPLPNFVNALCDKDYSYLYIKDAPQGGNTALEENHFNMLYLDYIDRMYGNDSSMYDNMKMMILLQSKIRIIEAAMLLIQSGHIDDNVKDVIQSFGMRLTGRSDKDILILSSIRETAIRHFNKVKDKFENSKDEASNGKTERKHFISILAGMSTHFKYNIPYREITAGEFCSYYVQMKEDISRIKRTQKNKSHGTAY